jgi:hypothetical protein
LDLERSMVRVGIGCGATAAAGVAGILVTIGTIVVAPWVNPTMAGNPGFGQGLGFLLLPFFALTPVVGLVAAIKPRIGAALGVLLVLALVVLFGAVLAGM